jgi:hypothetical protein
MFNLCYKATDFTGIKQIYLPTKTDGSWAGVFQNYADIRFFLSF